MKRFVNCRAYAFDPASGSYETHAAFATEGTRFSAFGDAAAGSGGRCIDLAGTTVVPAFADCHVHLADTGFMLGARDLGAARDAGAFAALVGALPREGAYVFGGNYDESRWTDGASATAAPLEAQHARSLALLTRIDGHSCLVNKRTFRCLELDAGLPGIERDPAGVPTGRLFLAANWTAQTRFVARLPQAARLAAARGAAALALSRGALHLHAQLLGLHSHAAYAAEIAALRTLPVKIYPKICERDPALAASLGLPYVGGDVFLDGSLGSGTAALCEPYRDRAGTGHLALDDAEVERYFADAERLGVSAGVHAIGDRAIEQCLSAWERVLGGRPSPRNRHFIEHFEVATPAQIARAGRLGLFLSVQPQFDALWGGAGGMYETRLGPDRARGMNALRSALRAGATLCGGDDSPVCALAPLDGMAAANAHTAPGERLQPLEALTMYTFDAARFGHVERRTGLLRAGYDADFVVLNRDPFADGDFAATRVLQTWSNGRCAFAA